MNFKSLLLSSLFLFLPDASALEFSKTEWDNPGRSGSTVWLRNEASKPIRIASAFVRHDGFQAGDEISLSFARRKRVYGVEQGPPGHWRRLIPRERQAIWLKARDSLLVHGFQYGSHLKSKKKAVPAKEFVLDLKLVDHRGDSSIVKISETIPNYGFDMHLGSHGQEGAGISEPLEEDGPRPAFFSPGSRSDRR